MSSIKRALLGLGAGTSLLLLGCAADNSPAQSSLVPGEQGIMCSKCQVTYVNVPNKVGKTIIGYRKQGVMECPDCKDNVENFFTTGNFDHTCKTCGDTMSICEAHPH
jgi:hypothetical protein